MVGILKRAGISHVSPPLVLGSALKHKLDIGKCIVAQKGASQPPAYLKVLWEKINRTEPGEQTVPARYYSVIYPVLTVRGVPQG